ncbi:hypothetical protein [Nocardioides sp. SYSU DS0663]|uniref:hypothetical protein n=1 Tax=Nocardioides sp. SYSU DS0663 TaxID=3416445 RepID=UPI003F4B5D54
MDETTQRLRYVMDQLEAELLQRMLTDEGYADAQAAQHAGAAAWTLEVTVPTRDGDEVTRTIERYAPDATVLGR